MKRKKSYEEIIVPYILNTVHSLKQCLFIHIYILDIIKGKLSTEFSRTLNDTRIESK